MALQYHLDAFRELGASLITLSPQLEPYASRWVTEDGIDFEVLLDLGNGVARDYGLVFRLPDDLQSLYRDGLKIDLARFNGDQSWELAIPATFVLSREGEIVFAEADPDYTTRPEPLEVLAAVRAVS